MAGQRRGGRPKRGDGKDAPRILGGELKGRPLAVPRGLATRPLRALARRSLFDVVGPSIRGAAAADLYAGAGTVGFEALSRGAERVCLVERAAPAVRALQSTIETFGVAARVRIAREDVRRFVTAAAERFDFVFAGPPYPLWSGDGRAELEEVAAGLAGILNPGGLLVLEAPGPADLPLPGLARDEIRRYGLTRLHFLRPA